MAVLACVKVKNLNTYENRPIYTENIVYYAYSELHNHYYLYRNH